MKHLWEKASLEVHADGGKRIRYVCKDFPGVSVYSNTECIPHANGSGGWMYRSFLVKTDYGFKKTFGRLKDAKDFVESGRQA